MLRHLCTPPNTVQKSVTRASVCVIEPNLEPSQHFAFVTTHLPFSESPLLLSVRVVVVAVVVATVVVVVVVNIDRELDWHSILVRLLAGSAERINTSYC